MKAYLTCSTLLSCSNSTISKWNQWNLGTDEYVNIAHERFLTHILNRISPRSSSNKPTVARWIDTQMHLLGKYTQKLASLFLETATDFQYSQILFYAVLHTSMYCNILPKRMFCWEPFDTFYSFIFSTCVRLPKFLNRYVPSVCVCMCVNTRTQVCMCSNCKSWTLP